jgi:hypothetical protein
MHLLTATMATRRSFARIGMVEQVRDLGRTLEYVLARYDRLVRELAGTDLPAPDFDGRIQQASRQVADVATRLQDLFVLEHEARLAEAYAAFEQMPATVRKPRPAVVSTRRQRHPPVERVVPIAAAQRFAERVAVQ